MAAHTVEMSAESIPEESDKESKNISQVSPRKANQLTEHQLRRVQKGVEQNIQTVESRIKFFRREEEKIWRDLEEVRRQAAKIEDGRKRALEKKLADKTISQRKEQNVEVNRVRASKQQGNNDRIKSISVEMIEKKCLAGDQQRKESEEILRLKKLEEVQHRLSRSEKVVSLQREQLEAKLKSNRERAERILRIREGQELARLEAARDVQLVESRLPELEAQEMACLQRLQNSRIVTQTVLQELEASLGSQSAVTAMLRTKQQRSTALLADCGDGKLMDTSTGESRAN